MEQVEAAIRRSFRAPVTLHTYGRHKPFELDEIDDEGVVLRLGKGRTYARLTWECLESIPQFLRTEPGWIVAGGEHSMAGRPARSITI